MSMNSSLDFLNMIKKDALEPKKNQKASARNKSISLDIERIETREISTTIAVIDTETNWRDEVMSIGIALSDSADFKCTETKYYIIDPEYRVGGIYSNVLRYRNGAGRAATDLYSTEVTLSRNQALRDIRNYLSSNGVKKIFAYNAKFDLGHLGELNDFEWYDIMRLAAYKQYNRAITDTFVCCKTGRLKTNYGVEPITRMLTGDNRYCEVHNAVYDAVDELAILELLGHPIEMYDVARINA